MADPFDVSGLTEAPRSADRMSERKRKRRLVIEFELPSFYVEDLPELIEELAGDAAIQPTPGEAILGALGEIETGALIVELTGEMDSTVVTTPVIARDARIEDEPPTEIDWLQEEVDRLVEAGSERYFDDRYERGYADGLKDGRDGGDRSAQVQAVAGVLHLQLAMCMDRAMPLAAQLVDAALAASERGDEG